MGFAGRTYHIVGNTILRLNGVTFKHKGVLVSLSAIDEFAISDYLEFNDYNKTTSSLFPSESISKKERK